MEQENLFIFAETQNPEHEMTSDTHISSGKIAVIKYARLLWFAVWLPAVSCTIKENISNRETIDRARQVIEDRPDSALSLLRTVNTGLLGDKDYYEYVLLEVTAKDKADKDISGDTAIFRAVGYFAGTGNNEKAAWAEFYSARIHELQQNDPMALTAYMDALTYIDGADHYLLKGKIQNNIGFMHYRMEWYDEAEYRFRQALYSFRAAGNEYAREGQELISIGNALLLQNSNDSAMHYYREALNLSHLHNDTTLLVSVYQNMGVVYYDLEQYAEAAEYSRIALAYAGRLNVKTKGQIYTNLAAICFETDKNDSVRYFLDRAQPLLLECNDMDILINLSRLFYRHEKENGNCAEALKYHEQYAGYTDADRENSNRQTILQLQKEYDLEVEENKNYRLTIKIHRIFNGMIVTALLAFVVVFLVNRQRARFKKMYGEAAHDADTLREMYGKGAKEGDKLRDALAQQLDIAVDIAKLDSLKGKNDITTTNKIHRIKSKYNSDTFMKAFNDIRPGLADKIKETWPGLDNKKVIICCMCLLDYENDVIAMITKMKQKTIEQYKYKIRKELGIPSRGPIKEFIEEFLQLKKQEDGNTE